VGLQFIHNTNFKFKNMARTPEATDDKFDVDKALNKKGFAEFLAKFQDAHEFDMEDEKELEKRFNSF